MAEGETELFKDAVGFVRRSVAIISGIRKLSNELDDVVVIEEDLIIREIIKQKEKWMEKEFLHRLLRIT